MAMGKHTSRTAGSHSFRLDIVCAAAEGSQPFTVDFIFVCDRQVERTQRMGG